VYDFVFASSRRSQSNPLSSDPYFDIDDAIIAEKITRNVPDASG
jgi:hypothetical protein